MQEVEEYILGLDENQKRIMLLLHSMLTEEFKLTDKIRFKIPFYYGKTWICYLNTLKNNKTELCFLRGNELSNHQNLLQSKGRKQVAGIELENANQIPFRQLKEIINEAIILDNIPKK